VLAIVAAIPIGAACTWPALFLYERVLRAMAYLEDLENSSGGMSVFLLFLYRHALRISWTAFFIVIFFGLPTYFFAANPYKQPLLGYILSFCVVLLLRFIPLKPPYACVGHLARATGTPANGLPVK
jgi:uncharacterized membrane protein SpoIIM required for sporulation